MEQKISIPPFSSFNFSAFYYAVVYLNTSFNKNDSISILLTGFRPGTGNGLNKSQGTNYASDAARLPPKYALPISGHCHVESSGREAKIYDPISDEELHKRLTRVLDSPVVAAQRLHIVLSLRRGSSPAFVLSSEDADLLEERYQAFHTQAQMQDAKQFALPYLAAALRIAAKNAAGFPLGQHSAAEELAPFSAALQIAVTASTDRARPTEPCPTLNLRALWEAGFRHWKTKQPAEKIIFAAHDAIETSFPAFVCTEEDPAPVLLTDVIEKTRQHCLILSPDGGAGKTTALRNIAQSRYGKENREDCEKTVPVYLDLSEAPDVAGPLYRGGESSFILRSLFRILLDPHEETFPPQSSDELLSPVFLADEEIIRARMEPLLKQKHAEPTFLLLLDGINEMSRSVPSGADMAPIAVMVQREISALAETYPNLRIIAAGRADDGIFNPEQICRYQLCKLDETTIFSYLSAQLPPARVEAVRKNPALLNILSLPMFIKIYVYLSDTGEADTQGELLHLYFGERKVDSEFYTARGHNRQIEKNLKTNVPRQAEGRLTAQLQDFILDFILPEIAWRMDGRFVIHGAGIEAALRAVLSEDSAVRSWAGTEAFPQYQDPYNPEKHADYFAQLLQAHGSSFRNLTDKIIAYCVSGLGILQRDGHIYRFSHQVFRDYFAALKITNAFRIAAQTHELSATLWGKEKSEVQERAYAYLCDVLGGATIDPVVRRMVGEVLGEHRNAPRCHAGKWFLPRPPEDGWHNLCCSMLDICRRHQADNDYTVPNLLQIIRDGRGNDLSGLDLSEIDLRRIQLNGVRLSRPGGPAAKFDGAQIARDTFFPVGHMSFVNSVAFSPDPSAHTMITASADGTAKLWDTRTGNCIGTLCGHMFDVTSAVFHPLNPCSVLTASMDGTAKLWDCETFACIQTLSKNISPIVRAVFSPDGNTIALASFDRTIRLWQIGRDGTYALIKPSLKLPDHIAHLQFHPDGSRLLAVTQAENAILRVWKKRGIGDGWDFIETDAKRLGMKGRITYAVYHPNGDRILVSAAHPNQSVEVDSDSLQPLREVWVNCPEDLSYTPDGKKLAAANGEFTLHDARNHGQILCASLYPNVRFPKTLLAFSPNGDLAAVSCGTSVEIRNTKTGEQSAVLNGYHLRLDSAVYHPLGNRLAITCGGKTVSVWSADQRADNGFSPFQHSTTLYGEDLIDQAEFHPNPETDQLLTFGKCIGSVSLWNVAAEKQIAAFREFGLEHAAYGRNGEAVLLASETGFLSVMGLGIWDPQTEELFYNAEPACYVTEGRIPLQDADNEEAVVIRYLCISGDRQTLSLWRVCDPDGISAFEQSASSEALVHDACFVSADFTSDGHAILAADKNGRLILFDSLLEKIQFTIDTGNPISRVSVNHSASLAAVIGSHDICLWEIREKELHPSQIPSAQFEKFINSITFSPDDRYLLVTLSDDTCQILDAGSLEVLQVITPVEGLFVRGINLLRAVAHGLSAEDRALLRLHGAEIDSSPAQI